jgi:hypothetical protein
MGYYSFKISIAASAFVPSPPGLFRAETSSLKVSPLEDPSLEEASWLDKRQEQNIVIAFRSAREVS